MLKRMAWALIVAALGSAVVAPAWAVEAATPPRRDEPGRFGMTIGGEYSTGDYGTGTDTAIWYFPLIFRYETERWLLRLTVPYLIVENAGNVVIVGGQPVGGHPMTGGGMGGGGMGGGTLIQPTTQTESGLGDIVAAASYTLQPGDAGRLGIDLTGKIYFGTADETKGLGSGENDVALQVDLTQDLGAVSLYGSGGYRVNGDPPGIDYRDVFYGTVGLERRLERNTVGLAFDAQQAVLADGDVFAELTAYLTLRPEKDRKLTTYLLLGLSDAAPDWGIGLTYTWYY